MFCRNTNTRAEPNNLHFYTDINQLKESACDILHFQNEICTVLLLRKIQGLSEHYYDTYAVCYDLFVLSSPRLQGLQSTFNPLSGPPHRIRTVKICKWCEPRVRENMGSGF